jgi:hypothetical protein
MLDRVSWCMPSLRFRFYVQHVQFLFYITEHRDFYNYAMFIPSWLGDALDMSFYCFAKSKFACTVSVLPFIILFLYYYAGFRMILGSCPSGSVFSTMHKCIMSSIKGTCIRLLLLIYQWSYNDVLRHVNVYLASGTPCRDYRPTLDSGFFLPILAMWPTHL